MTEDLDAQEAAEIRIRMSEDRARSRYENYDATVLPFEEQLDNDDKKAIYKIVNESEDPAETYYQMAVTANDELSYDGAIKKPWNIPTEISDEELFDGDTHD